ncbi:MAG: choice-of-anchor L domain-containing protein [Bacteroidia bacterium]|nr:choice-of-anchor L domain-containing protein [Bacteroidia bacterium]
MLRTRMHTSWHPIKSLFLLLAFFVFSAQLNAQLTTQANSNAVQLANALMGPGISVSNVVLNCPAGASGFFQSNNSNIGLASGVLLTSGSVTNAGGLNSSNSSGVNNLGGGDSQLDNLTTSSTFDACALEFDFVANCDTIQIAYVFGSEEYPEFVNSGVNDVFAFFISGPGYVGAVNIAVIPGTSTAISIDNVNTGNWQCGGVPTGCTNCAYYVDNCGGTTVQYDGFTVPLVAKAAVVPCSTYHVKLAIADAGDGIYDSGVFLEQNGIQCASAITVSSQTNSALANNAVEGCVDGIFTFFRLGDTTVADTLNYIVQGSATPGVDYTPLSGQVIIPAGDTAVSVIITAFADNLPEGTESIIVILPDTICSMVQYDTAYIYIVDPPEADAGPDHSFCIGGSAQMGTSNNPALTYTWVPPTFLNNSTISNPTTTPSQDSTFIYYVAIVDTNGCSDTDSVAITVFPLPTSDFTVTSMVCIGSNATVTYTGTSTQGAVFAWSFGVGGSVVSGSGSGPYQITYSSAGVKTISLTVTDSTGCVSTVTQVNITVAAPATLSTAPTGVSCPGASDGSIDLTVNGGTSPFTFAWTGPGSFTSAVEDPSGLAAGSYDVTVTDSLGCTSTANVVVTAPPGSLWPFIIPTNVNCNGASDGAANLSVTGGNAPFSFLWSNGAITEDISNLAPGTYYVAIQDANGCTITDSVVISEPSALGINFVVTDVACNGDSNGIIEASGTGGHGHYSYVWTPGGATSDSIGALAPGTYVLTLTDSSLNDNDVLLYFEDFDGYAPWLINVPTGINQPDSNFWVISDNEGGVPPPGCGLANNGNNTLHITSQFCPTCGAAYDAGGVITNTTTQLRAESPMINTVGYSNLTLEFDYIANGDALKDNCSVWFNAGGGWTLLNASIKSPVCINAQGQWTLFTAALPASCNNIPNLQIGFEWVNDNDGLGTDPSVAINDVRITSPGIGPVVLCSFVDSATVNDPAPLTLAMSGTDISCNGGSDGTATATVGGGNGNYSYLWSNGQTTATATGLTAGTYVVTVSDTAFTNATTITTTVIFSEDFDPAPANWKLDDTTGVLDANYNFWQIDDDEGGVLPPGCGVANNGDQTLHITSQLFPTFGAAYDAGGGFLTNTTTNMRAHTPLISTIGIATPITINFDYIGNGQALLDNGFVEYNDGSGWTTLNPSLKTPVCVGGQGLWTAFTAVLPVSCNNIPNLRIGFHWKNNNDGIGTDPSIAINNLELITQSSSSGGSGFVLCEIVDSITLSEPTPLVLVGDSSLVSCPGISNGTAWVTVSGGTPGYSYAWNTTPVQVTDTAYFLVVGSVDVTVTDANGCQDSLTIGITAVPGMNLVTSSTDVSCNGGKNGTASVAVTGGNGNYSYSWNSNPIQTTATASNLSAGSYTVTVTDGAGCISQATVLVNQPAQLLVSATGTNISCAGGSDGTLTAVVAGGTGPFNYTWNPGGYSSSFVSGLPIGTYTLIVVDANGCTDTAYRALSEPTPISLNGNTTPDQCWVSNGNGTALVNPSGGTPPYTYQWNTFPVQFTQYATGLTQGNYTCVVTDGLGCQDSITLSVAYIPPPTVTPGPAVSFCDGEGGALITATPSGGTGPYYYTWSCNQPICGLDSIHDNDPIANPTVTSWYYVTVSDNNGCISNTDSVLVTVLPKPLVDAGPDVYICADSAPCKILNASITGAPGPYNYQWLPSAGLNNDTILNPCARPDSTTIYTLVVVSVNGCQSNFTTVDTNSSVTVHINPMPIADAGPDTNICFLDTVELTGIGYGAGPNYTYQWSPATYLSNSNVPNPDAWPALSTWYTLVVWSNGCPSYGDSALVTVHTNPTASAGNTKDICLNEVEVLDGDASGDSTSNSYTYYWWPSTGVIGSTAVEDLTVSPDTSTWYYVQATSEWGCKSAVDSVLLQVIPTPIAEAGPDKIICEGHSVQLDGFYGYTSTAAAPANQVYITWTPPDSLSSTTIATPMAHPVVSTYYYMTVQYNLCSTMDSVLVTVMPDLGATATVDTNVICEGDSVQLLSSGGLGSAQFNWYPPTGLSDPQATNPKAAPSVSTTYMLIVSEGGCEDTVEVPIEVLPTPEASFIHSVKEGCVPFTVNFLENGSGGVAYTFNFGDGTAVSNEPNPTHEYTTPGIFPVRLTAVSQGGCSSTTDPVYVVVDDTATAEFTSDPAYPAQLALPGTEVGFINQSNLATYWLWDFGDGVTSGDQFPSHQFTEPGTYWVTLTVANSMGCITHVTHGPYLVVSPELLIPNVFTPNGDGFQDRFIVTYTGSQPFLMTITDRWGVQHYNGRNKNEGWDGKTIDGADAKEGVYFYTVTIGGKEFVGNLTLLR